MTDTLSDRWLLFNQLTGRQTYKTLTDRQPWLLPFLQRIFSLKWKGKQNREWKKEACKKSVLYKNFDLCFPRNETAWPRSQFLHSCICEQFIYSQDRSANFAAANNKAAKFHFWEHINRNQTYILDSHRPFLCSVYVGGLVIKIKVDTVVSRRQSKVWRVGLARMGGRAAYTVYKQPGR